MSRPFSPGREFNSRFYQDAVAPILRRRFRGLSYAAALLGPGSEVLGYDTELSPDHDWGPRAQIYLLPKDAARFRGPIRRALRKDLPPTFEGLPTRFSAPDSDGVRVRVRRTRHAVGEPNVWIGTIRGYFDSYLHVDVARPLKDLDWLLLPQQKLLSIVRGPVFHDGIGLGRLRARFQYFPRDVWLHLLAVQWLRISEEEAFVGRTGAVGDELGARLIAARQVREMMRLAFLLERTYIPYDKWFGTAFRELQVGPTLMPLLLAALEAETPPPRERALARAYELLARKQNALRLARALPVHVSKYHSRPYLVIHSGEFARVVRKRIRDRRIRELTRIGSVDQFASTEELGAHAKQLSALRTLLLR